MTIAQQQQEWGLQVENPDDTWTVIPMSNAPEFNFEQNTTRSVRRAGDAGKVMKHRINKLQEAFEFSVTVDYDPDNTIVAYLEGVKGNDTGANFRLVNNGSVNTHTTEFNALVVNSSITPSDPNDAEAVEMVTFTIRQNGDVNRSSAPLA